MKMKIKNFWIISKFGLTSRKSHSANGKTKCDNLKTQLIATRLCLMKIVTSFADFRSFRK